MSCPEVVFLQPTPFCNIDCDYCYLAGRERTDRMSFETLRRSLQWVREMGRPEEGFCLVWHLGEPLSVPIPWYREAHQICSETLGDSPLEIHFQTNGTLLSPQWIELIRDDPRIRIALSIDGPAEIHDRHRKTRRKAPTHALVMKGIELLRQAGIPFDAIAVATEATLDRADEFYEFFANIGVRMLSINAESITGAHRTSSIEGREAESRYRRFLHRIAQLHLSQRRFVIRNFLWAQLRLQALQTRNADRGCEQGNRLNRAWRLLSIDWQGHFHTFSPSLLGMALPEIGKSLGNVWTQGVREARSSPSLHRLQAQIDSGVERCRRGCLHFSNCGGGSPSHKWFEHGTFEVTETVHCRVGVQTNWEEFLSAAEEQVGSVCENARTGPFA